MERRSTPAYIAEFVGTFLLVLFIALAVTVYAGGGGSPDLVAIGLVHTFGLQVTLNLSLRAGACVVLMPRFEIEGFLATIQRHQVTRAANNPRQYSVIREGVAIEVADLKERGYGVKRCPCAAGMKIGEP